VYTNFEWIYLHPQLLRLFCKWWVLSWGLPLPQLQEQHGAYGGESQSCEGLLTGYCIPQIYTSWYSKVSVTYYVVVWKWYSLKYKPMHLQTKTHPLLNIVQGHFADKRSFASLPFCSYSREESVTSDSLLQYGTHTAAALELFYMCSVWAHFWLMYPKPNPPPLWVATKVHCPW